MPRSHGIALAGLTVLLVSTTSPPSYAQLRGEQCVPAVANPQMYANCHLRVVRTPDGLNEVCRCRILPQARRAVDQDNLTTGSVGVHAPPFAGPVNGYTPRIRDGWTDPATGISRPRTDSRGASRSTGTVGTTGSSIGGSAARPRASQPGGRGGNNLGGGGPVAVNPGGAAAPVIPRDSDRPGRGNNGVGNGQDLQPPGNPPINDGDNTGPGTPGNKGGKGGKGRPNGNNGVGNGLDGQPPGSPPVNDGAGTGPGKPGNRGGNGSSESLGNPGNSMSVGRAGETPNGGSQGSWGNDESGSPGTRGRSDAGRTGSTASTGDAGASSGSAASSESGGGRGRGAGNSNGGGRGNGGSGGGKAGGNR